VWFNADAHRQSGLCRRWGELRAEIERVESEVTLVGPADVTEAAQRAVFAMESIGYVVRDWRAIRVVQTQTAELRETSFWKSAADAEETFVQIAATAVGNRHYGALLRRRHRRGCRRNSSRTGRRRRDRPRRPASTTPTSTDSPSQTLPQETTLSLRTRGVGVQVIHHIGVSCRALWRTIRKRWMS
jgi:hypothetical protein